MSATPHEPWTNLPDEDFLRDVLAARARHGPLDDDGVKRLVACSLPRSLPWGRWSYESTPNRASARLIQVPFEHIVFGRSDVLADPFRIESIVRGLLHNPNVDEFSRASLWRSPAGHSFWVEAGNHRLVAQHLLGMEPWAMMTG